MGSNIKKSRLLVELIPKTCWWSSVRTTVKKAEWDKIRFIAYEKAGDKCEICGESGKDQGYKHNVECHEIWEYDDENKVQKLTGLVALCVNCHQVKHIGRAIKIGKQAICYKQMAKVNKWTPKDIQDHLDFSFSVYFERSKYNWTLDLSILTKEPYNLKIDANKKRIFKVKKHNRKKKKAKNKTAAKKAAVLKAGKRPPKRKR